MSATPKGQAATWTRTSKTTWDVEFKGYQFEGVKQDGIWNLYLVADEPVIAVESGEKTLRQFWNVATEYFKTSQPLALAAIALHDENALAQVTEDEAPEAPEAPVATDECPKCHKSGDEKCVTGSGKKVKENGGYHTARLELREALGL